MPLTFTDNLLYYKDSQGQYKHILTGANMTGYRTAAAQDAIDNNKQKKVEKKSITLSTSWSGTDPYTQTVTVSGYTITANSKVDLQPDAATVNQLITDGVKALYIENNNGTLTAYAIGAAPTAAMTIQCTIAEVTV